MILISLTRLNITDVKLYLLVQRDVWDALIKTSIQYDIISEKYFYARGTVWKNVYQDTNHFSLSGSPTDNNSFTLPDFSISSIMTTD